MKYRFISLVNFQEGNAANEAADKALVYIRRTYDRCPKYANGRRLETVRIFSLLHGFT